MFNQILQTVVTPIIDASDLTLWNERSQLQKLAAVIN